RKVRVDQDFAEPDAFGREDVQEQALRTVEMRLREPVGTQPVLVADHDQPVTCLDRDLERRNRSRHQPELFMAVDLLVRRLLDEGAVAIEEQHPGRHGAHAASPAGSRTGMATPKAASTASLSSGQPMPMRRQSPSEVCADTSRTRMPASTSARYRSEALSTRTSRKLAVDACTQRTPLAQARPARTRSRSA